jgi:hypothetical protein
MNYKRQYFRSLGLQFISLYRTASILYCIAFAVYVLFSRNPDYFESETTRGTIINPNTLDAAVLKKFHLTVDDYPVVIFAEGTETYYFNGSDNYFLTAIKPNETVRVIFNPGDPKQACIYRFWGYWINADELLYSVMGFAILLGVAILITGKNDTDNEQDEDLLRRIKYN